MDRRNARAGAMKLVYEWLLGGDGGDETLTGLLDIKPGENKTDFMNGLFEGVKEHKDDLDATIAGFLSEGWQIDRISKVDYAVLLVAVYEMKYTKTGESIVINEAVDLANLYSTDKSGAYVNGILGSIARSGRDA